MRNGQNELAVNIEGLRYNVGTYFSATLNPSETVYHPAAPLLDTPVTNNGQVTLSWQADPDAIGNETFEYVVFDKDGRVVAGTNVADYATGKRKSPTNGNACEAKAITLSLPEGEYTYGVQTVSGAYEGSEFAKGSFSITGTGIRSAEVGANADEAIYDLQGRQLSKPARGVNIVGNKKIIVE